METKVCFLGGARYSRPLDATSEKKFRSMKSLGEIFVVGFSGAPGARRFDEHAHFYLLPDVPMAALRYLEMFILGPVVLLRLIVREGVQTIVAQSPYEGGAGALVKIMAGWVGHKIALIVENHGDFEESLFMQRRVRFSGLYRILMRATANFALNHANVLRSISSATRRQLEHWRPGTPIVQFPAWTDMESFLSASRGKNDTSPFQEILYTGVLIPRKGVHCLIGAFAQLAKDFASVRLVIVGDDGNKAYTAELKKLVQKFDLREQVRFLPPMPQAELAKRMSEARAFVLPSLSEGLGRVVFEAMASGTPVVGSGVGGIPDMVEDGVTGFLVPPGDERMLAEKLRWLLEHPAEATVMGERAHLAAERLFSTEAYLRGYRKLFSTARGTPGEESGHAHSPL
jgi:glycosyltransferase involved in cell wall biosynthesis